jgi:urocanate hydratase
MTQPSTALQLQAPRSVRAPNGADGVDASAERRKRVLWNDPGAALMRHADVGYASAIVCAEAQGLTRPLK